MSIAKFREYLIGGKLAVTITSKIDKDLIDKLIKLKPVFISLNYAKGWLESDINFLENHTEIEGLDIGEHGPKLVLYLTSMALSKTIFRNQNERSFKDAR